MRQIVEAVDRGESPPGVDDAEIEKHARLTAELDHRVRNEVLIPFLQAHPEISSEITVGAFLSVAAVHAIAELEMGPDDFVELARAVHRLSRPEAEELRKRVLSRGRA